MERSEKTLLMTVIYFANCHHVQYCKTTFFSGACKVPNSAANNETIFKNEKNEMNRTLFS